MRLGKGFQRAWTFLQSKSKLGKRKNRDSQVNQVDQVLYSGFPVKGSLSAAD